MYSARGGIEAVYDNMPGGVGLATFAPLTPAKGGMVSARKRLGRLGESGPAPVDVDEYAGVG